MRLIWHPTGKVRALVGLFWLPIAARLSVAETLILHFLLIGVLKFLDHLHRRLWIGLGESGNKVRRLLALLLLLHIGAVQFAQG